MRIQLLIAIGLASFSLMAFAQTQVKGYYKKNGTYVAPYTRSSPNSTRTDNYGSAPKKSGSVYSSSYSSPYTRDKDKDGVSNQYDQDDDNDGTNDDYDSTP